MSYSRVELDSSVAKAMLNTAIMRPTVKHILQEVALQLREKVFKFLKQETANSIESFKNKYNGLAMQHSQDDKAIGALLPAYSQEYLLTADGQKLLLETLDLYLKNPTLDTESDFLSLMKIFDGMGYVYHRMQAETPSELYQACKDLIMPTPDEEKMRVLREKNQQSPHKFFATTYGIGTEIDIDLKTGQKTSNGCYSGKARFFIAPIHEREEGFKIKTFLDNMASSLPLIAGPSSSTARFLIMAHCIDLFKDKYGLFNLNQAQIVVNCLMAYFVYCGHHSFLEIIEIWNRYLDFLVLNRSEKLEIRTMLNKTSTDALELKLPYARIGSYSSFLHPSYAESVIVQMYQQLKDGLDLHFNP